MKYIFAKMSQVIKILPVGRLGYLQACKVQKYISSEVTNKRLPDTLVVVEHSPVYTVGIREKIYSLEEEQKLIALGAEFHRTNRGGLITFHGPGQMVVYPIINLKNYKPCVRWYVSSLERAIIDLCKNYNLEAYTTPHTGVWVNDMKICAIGIHASRYVTSHGLALNCNIDLTWFSHIVPCGIEGKTVTSLTAELKKDTSIQDALPNFKTSFSSVFECKIDEYSIKEKELILKCLKEK